jgi:hypothetical protein
MVEFLNKKNAVYLINHLFFAILVVLIIELTKYILGVIEPEVNKLSEMYFSNFSLFVFQIVIFSPILEEIVFRLALKKNKYFWLSLLFSLLFLLTSNFVLVKIVMLLFILNIIIYQFSDRFIELYYSLIFFSILAFVAVHFDNYELKMFQTGNIRDMVILFLPQFFLSLILTKIRIQTHLLNSILFHFVFNLIVMQLAILFDQ